MPNLFSGKGNENVLQVNSPERKAALMPGDVPVRLLSVPEVEGLNASVGDAVQSPCPQGIHQILRGVQGYYPAFVKESDTVGQELGLFYVVSSEKDSRPALLDLFDKRPYAAPDRGVETRCRFIEKEYLRRVHERPCDHHSSFHASGEGLYRAVYSVCDFHVLKEFADALHPLFSRHQEESSVQVQVLAHCQFVVEIDVLRYKSALPFGMKAFLLNMKPVQPRITRRRDRKSGKYFDGRCLARTIRSQVCEQLTLKNPEADALEGFHLFVSLPEVFESDHNSFRRYR